jgi:hypothetical protein
MLGPELRVELESLAGALEPEVRVDVLPEVELAARVVEALVEAADLAKRVRSEQDVSSDVLVVAAEHLRDVRERRRPRRSGAGFDTSLHSVGSVRRRRERLDSVDPARARKLVCVEQRHPGCTYARQRPVSRRPRPAVGGGAHDLELDPSGEVMPELGLERIGCGVVGDDHRHRLGARLRSHGGEEPSQPLGVAVGRHDHGHVPHLASSWWSSTRGRATIDQS